MKVMYWIAIALEILAAGYYYSRIWLLARQDADTVYPEDYRKVLLPALVLTLIIAGALVAKLVFKAQRVSLIIAFLPAIALILSMVGMALATIFIGGKWR